MFSRRLFFPLLLAVLVASAAPARAEFGGVPDRVQLFIGGTFADFVTEGGLSLASAGTGVSINFEDLFDIPVSQSAGRIDGYWRFSDKGYVDFGYVQFNRSGARILTEDVNWGEFTLHQGAYVQATWDSRFPYAAYRHDFLQEDRVRISGSAGLSYLRIAPSLETDGVVTGPPNNTQVTGHFEKGVDVQFPVPLVGLQLNWILRNRLEVEMFTRIFYLNYQSLVEGGMREATARLKWHFSKHVGGAIGYDSTSIRLKEYETGNYKAKFNYDASGFSAYLTLAF